MGLLRKMLRPARVGKKLVKTAFKTQINNAKGSIGESKVIAKLNPRFFGKVEHRLINNLMLVDENGKSHQIDHVEIRQNGIFCIETKNYSGWIFGSESQAMWTQTLRREKHQFPNPIKQNNAHIYHLNRVLNGKYKINPVVVMVQNNASRVGVPYVVNLRYLRSYLSSFSDGTKYSIKEMDGIYQTLLRAARSDVTKEEHIESIRRTQEDIQNRICPRCGSALVLREGKYGKFYGCSNYPKCNFTAKP